MRVQRGEETVAGALSGAPRHAVRRARLSRSSISIRELRTGMPEVIFGEGKTVAQIAAIAERLAADGQTRARHAPRRQRRPRRSRRCSRRSCTIRTRASPCSPRSTGRRRAAPGCIVVASARHGRPAGRRGGGLHRRAHGQPRSTASTTSASPDCIACSRPGERLRARARRDRRWRAWRARLPSVVGGLVDLPVIAVPTSIGYGASFGGLAALLAMMNSCAAGITVVNVDNGFGAGVAASRINRRWDAARESNSSRAPVRDPPPLASVAPSTRARRKRTAGRRRTSATHDRPRPPRAQGRQLDDVGRLELPLAGVEAPVPIAGSDRARSARRPRAERRPHRRGLDRAQGRLHEARPDAEHAWNDLLPLARARGAVDRAVVGAADGRGRHPRPDHARARRPPERLFAEFESEAFAAASLGQSASRPARDAARPSS